MPLDLSAASEEQARSLVETVRMTARYHQTIKPLKALVAPGTLGGGQVPLERSREGIETHQGKE